MNGRQIHETYEYDLFKLMEENRSLDPKNLKEITESMKEKKLPMPIIVDSDYRIIDGQHRFTACKNLGLSIEYIIEDGLGVDDVIRANVNGGKKWNDADYLNMNLQSNFEIYKEIYDIINHYNITTYDYQKIIANLQNKKLTVVKSEFQKGIMDISSHIEVIKFLDNLEKFKDFTCYKSSNFINAFLRLYTHHNYSQESMDKRLDNRIGSLMKMTTIDDYLVILCRDIYSYGCLTNNRIMYSKDTKSFYR